MGDDQNVATDRVESGPETADSGETDEAVRQEVQLRAYHRYCERGCAPGYELDDWLAAEQEVLAAHAAAVSPSAKTSADERGPRGRRPGRTGR